MPKTNKGYVLHFDPQGNSVNMISSGENSFFVHLNPATNEFRILNSRLNTVVFLGSANSRKQALAKISKALNKLVDKDKIITAKNKLKRM